MSDNTRCVYSHKNPRLDSALARCDEMEVKTWEEVFE